MNQDSTVVMRALKDGVQYPYEKITYSAGEEFECDVKDAEALRIAQLAEYVEHHEVFPPPAAQRPKNNYQPSRGRSKH
jgi:hypothetical protein